ncbi:MAG: Co2+/Mg2+ efflux protein ApaG [Flavobacteriales bacterium]|nr:Co2+/Mg2+ efflux protein ApaG [Flavobacteriales bacterium]
MVTAITKNIEVSVETSYQQNQSRPDLNYFLFSYRITISNEGEFTVQLLSRFWDIFDSHMERRYVEGAGVVGDQPVLAPGESYQYESFCQLKSDAGIMKGHYNFKREVDDQEFKVIIPEFNLIPDFRNN